MRILTYLSKYMQIQWNKEKKIKRIVLGFIISIIIMANSYSQEYTNNQYSYWDTSLKLFDKTITKRVLDRIEGEIIETTHNYEIKKEGALTYYIIDGTKYLVLRDNEILYLFKGNTKPVFAGSMYGPMANEFLYPAQTPISSSCLNENGRVFNSITMSDKLGEPWVEDGDGYGIGEWISFSIRSKQTIYISIGYVDFDKPELYTENSRPKKIRLYLDDNFYKDVELKDTPDFQKIKLPPNRFGPDMTKLKIEILEVYKGTKYDDTCINMVIVDRTGRTEEETK